MNFLIDSDSNYLYQTATLIHSISKNSIELNTFYFCQYSDKQLDDKSITFLKKHLNSGDSLKIIDLPHIQINLNMGRWGDQAYIRLLGLTALPDDVERIIRVDGDVIINGDVGTFYKYAFDGNAIVCTKECLAWNNDKINKLNIADGLYINSGVVLFNVKAYKNCFKTIKEIEIALNNPLFSTALDQDFVNFHFKDKKIVLSTDKYMRFCAKYHTIDKDYKDKNPVILHYAGFHKPWLPHGFVNYRRIYWKYAKNVFPREYIKKYKRDRFVWIILSPFRIAKRLLSK